MEHLVLLRQDLPQLNRLRIKRGRHDLLEILIKALMFRQDYRINKIFLPFQPVPLKSGKKGKKNHPSSRESFHLLRQQNSNARGKNIHC